MDIRRQRHLILASMLGLDPDLPVEHVLVTAKELFANNLVSVELKRKILEAFSDLHMKAVRRLVIAGGLRPRDLSLGCQIEPVSPQRLLIYIIFLSFGWIFSHEKSSSHFKNGRLLKTVFLGYLFQMVIFHKLMVELSNAIDIIYFNLKII